MRDIEIYLNDALRDVALEIRSVDVIELASSLHTLKLANVADIVHSALELHFKPEAICFGHSGAVELGWFGRPAVSLDLELHNAGVDAHFCLVIEAMGSCVHLRNAVVDGEPWQEQHGTHRICAAIEESRVTNSAHWQAAGSHLQLAGFRLN